MEKSTQSQPEESIASDQRNFLPDDVMPELADMDVTSATPGRVRADRSKKKEKEKEEKLARIARAKERKVESDPGKLSAKNPVILDKAAKDAPRFNDADLRSRLKHMVGHQDESFEGEPGPVLAGVRVGRRMAFAKNTKPGAQDQLEQAISSFHPVLAQRIREQNQRIQKVESGLPPAVQTHIAQLRGEQGRAYNPSGANQDELRLARAFVAAGQGTHAEDHALNRIVQDRIKSRQEKIGQPRKPEKGGGSYEAMTDEEVQKIIRKASVLPVSLMGSDIAPTGSTLSRCPHCYGVTHDATVPGDVDKKEKEQYPAEVQTGLKPPKSSGEPEKKV